MATASGEDTSTGSDDDSGSDDTVRGVQPRGRHVQLPVGDKDCPRLFPDELDVVRQTILHTVLPSWIDRVPQNLGSACHGSLKAAEWLILYKFYYTIALIPLWIRSKDEGSPSQSNTRTSLLLESTTTLSQVAHFLTLPTIKVQDLPELDSLILKYRQCLLTGWPGKSSKPNLHLTQHFSDVIRRFGPPRSTAAWAQERVNGMLQRLPTNNHPDNIPKTLLNKWHINSNLRSLENEPSYVRSSTEQDLEIAASTTTQL
ncbi:hypothetical protein PTTG_29751 [Puccinia triticina 1-1 BBBD Race 1]|uniref:Uncharacterized protein n=1 Tax=Puccinia triticina (isolate 1-1 / race 1 (BBBD)) TaxID=630390 RepID=A0A180G2D0_PUCT1|nr:hypothetical protein PTTG_29751 [Puccinia triticina 1-1 BBBD Race 1]